MRSFIFSGVLFLSSALIFPSLSLGQDIGDIRKEFDEKTGSALARIKDVAAVEDVSARLPGGRTLRQTVKVFGKNGKIRMEVEALSKSGESLKFLTISAGGEIWMLTPHGKMAKMDPSVHGGVRPDPLIKYLSISVKPGAKAAGTAEWDGRAAIIVDNGGGERIWLDLKSMVPLKLETLLPMEGKVEWIFRDFKMTNGVAQLPHDIKYSSDSAVFYHNVALAALNAGLDDGLFDPQIAAGAPDKE